jgi:DNA-binding response OmpR family regulator
MNKKILLVEDEALIAMAEESTLRGNGFEVVSVSTGEKALAEKERLMKELNHRVKNNLSS